MGHKWKRWYVSTSVEPEIDLLSTAFGLPSRGELKRATQASSPSQVSQYNFESDETSDSSQAEESDDSFSFSSVAATVRKPKRRALHQVTTPVPRTPSKKRQHDQNRTSSLESHRSTLSKKPKGCRTHKVDTGDRNHSSSKAAVKSHRRVLSSTSSSTHLSTPTIVRANHRKSPSNTIRDLGLAPNDPHAVLNNNLPQQSHIYAQQNVPTFTPHYTPAHVLYPQSSCYIAASTTGHSNIAALSKGSNFQELQKLQLRLDQIRRELMQKPQGATLQKDHQDAQNQLNSVLNTIVTTKLQATGNVMPAADQPCSDAAKTSEPTLDKENEAPLDDGCTTETMPPFSPQGERDRTLLIAHRRRKSPFCTIRHHLCSGCGGVRSQAFHEKHPVESEHKPILNFCSSCREQRLEKNSMDQYHFCFGCGKVRSKLFQRKHKHESGQSLLPNYCGSCTAEVKTKEGIDDKSILGVSAMESGQRSERNSSTLHTTSTSITIESTGHDLSSPKSHHQTDQLPLKPSRSRNAARLHLDHASLANAVSIPVSPAESSPFYPGRRLGSAQRRAQRAPTPHLSEEHQSEGDSSGVQVDYRAPYVEEVDSIRETLTSASDCSNMGALADHTVYREDSSGIWQGGGGSGLDMRGHDVKNCQIPDAAHDNHAALQPTQSSEVKTVRCCPLVDTRARHSEAAGNEGPRHNPQNLPRHTSIHEESSFSKGVFGKSANVTGDLGQTTRRKSPLADFDTDFDPSNNATFINEGGLNTKFHQDCTAGHESPAFQSSRGAFGKCTPKKSHFSLFDYSLAGSKQSVSWGLVSRGPEMSEDQPKSEAGWGGDISPRDADRYPQPRQANSANSSFCSDSNSGQGTGNFKPHVPDEGPYSRSVFTNYSRSTNNPYYQPRRCTVYKTSQSDSCDTWKWTSNRRRDHENPKSRSCQFGDRMPVPIIEEPISPNSSPVLRTKLLEYNFHDETPSRNTETGDDGSAMDHAELQHELLFLGAAHRCSSTYD